MHYEEKVKEVLGENAYNKFLDAVDEGKVSLQQMTDIAFGLHKDVGGKFKRSKSNQAFEFNRAAARQVLSDWFQYDLCETDNSDTAKNGSSRF